MGLGIDLISLISDYGFSFITNVIYFVRCFILIMLLVVLLLSRVETFFEKLVTR
jgi:hypothetical protein